MITDSLNRQGKYDYLKERMQKAYAFLSGTDLTALPLGRNTIDGDDVFAMVQEYVTMPASELSFETHDRYFDIQYIVSGRECIGLADRSALEPSGPYDAAGDMTLYREPAETGAVILDAGDFAVVSPEEAHKPRCRCGQAVPVRKIVVKVRV